MNARCLILSALALVLVSSVAVASALPGAAAGKKLVSSQGCAMCHQAGGIAKPLSAYAGKPASKLKAAMLEPKKVLGSTTMMPSYRGKLSTAQLDAVVAFIKAGAR